MDNRTYTILTEKKEEVEKKLKRIGKKAQKYNVPFSFSFGEPYSIELKHRNDYDVVVTDRYEVADLTIVSEEIKNGDYTVIAHLEHDTNGNIVNVFEGSMKAEWVHCAPFCEHCNSNHNLRYTFMVSNGKETKQVGRNCLKDYCGIDPQMIGIFNAFYGEIEEYNAHDYYDGEPIPCVYDSIDVLALAIEVAEAQGYIKSDERDSNKSEIVKAISHRDFAKKENYDKAVEMAQAIADMPTEEAVEALLNNVQVRINGKYCKGSDFGYFAYAPIAYARHIERKAEAERRAKEKESMSAQSEYVGTVGERSEFNVETATLLTSFPSQYGYTFLYRFIDTNGNVLIWFASSAIDVENVKRIKATVKNHTEREGVKQTILTRVKVA